MSEQEDAVETASSSDRMSSLSSASFGRLQGYLRSDSYAFTKVVCGHRDLIPEFHMPLSYVVCGLTSKLVPLLNDQSFDSAATRAIRTELWKRQIDWNTPDGFTQLDALLDFVNIRTYRGSFKSSYGTHGGALFIATNDPNETIWLVSNSDPNAWAFCDQIAMTVREGDAYRRLFGDRIPLAPKDSLTSKHITLAGRTISHPQTTIEADGYKTKRISAHFSTFIIDDLVVKENSSIVELRGVRQWLTGMTGFEMPTRRIRRVHIGTIWEEDDDNKFLTSGKLASECLTINIPIEVYEGGVVEDISRRGKPTNPKLHPTPKIQKLFDKIIADPDEGPNSWRCNYLLDATAGGARIFPASVVDDPERSWIRARLPLKDGKEPPRPRHDGMRRCFVARLLRDEEGQKLVKPDWKGEEGDPRRFRYVVLDPMADLDRVMTIDSSWTEGGDNWACTVEGQDHQAVRCQLETQSDTTGLEGWIEAAVEMAEWWRPRIIGFDNGGIQDAAIKNIVKTDKRLRKIRGMFVGINHKQQSKKSRIKNFVAEPLKMRRLLLCPSIAGDVKDIGGGAKTRGELKGYKGDPNATDGIADSLSMAPAVHVAKASKEEREERMKRLLQRNAMLGRLIDPYTGVPFAA